MCISGIDVGAEHGRTGEGVDPEPHQLLEAHRSLSATGRKGIFHISS